MILQHRPYGCPTVLAVLSCHSDVPSHFFVVFLDAHVSVRHPEPSGQRRGGLDPTDAITRKQRREEACHRSFASAAGWPGRSRALARMGGVSPIKHCRATTRLGSLQGEYPNHSIGARPAPEVPAVYCRGQPPMGNRLEELRPAGAEQRQEFSQIFEMLSLHKLIADSGL